MKRKPTALERALEESLAKLADHDRVVKLRCGGWCENTLEAKARHKGFCKGSH